MDDWKAKLVAFFLVVALICGVVFIIVGPAGISRHFSSWKAEAYGSDWLVIQYTGMGKIQSHWELHGRSIGNEQASDGIFFKDDDGNIVHLSGHYMYIQVTDAKWGGKDGKDNVGFEQMKARYLTEK